MTSPTDEAPVETAHRSPDVRRQATSVCAVLMVVLLAAARAWRLGHPGNLVFDEVYYVNDAVDLAIHGVERSTAVHPPLGKWPIALSIRLFSVHPFSWRLPALLAGYATTAATAAIVWRTTRSRQLTWAAAVFSLSDGLAFVTARLALLDGFLTLLAVLTLWAALPLAGRAPPRARNLLSAGGLCGLAAAVKWTGALLLPVVCTAAVLSHARSCRLRRALASGAIAATAAAAAYAVAWAPAIVNADDAWFHRTETHAGILSGAAEVLSAHRRIAEFHRNLVPQNPYSGAAWTWPINTDAVLLWAGACVESPPCPTTADQRPVIIALANPVGWLAGIAAVSCSTVRAFTRRSGRSALIAASAGALWVPWLLSDRASYNFYGAALVPILAVAVATETPPRHARKAAALAFIAAIAFALWLPYASGWHPPSGYTDVVLPDAMQP